MRQAVLLDSDDLVALRQGAPLTIAVGEHHVTVMLAPSHKRVPGFESQGPKAHTRWSLTKCSRIVKAHDACESGTKAAFLRRRHLRSSDIWRFKQRLKKAEKGGK